MILIFHNAKTVSRIDFGSRDAIPYSNDAIALIVLKMAMAFPDEKIVWCHQAIENHLNIDFIESHQAYQNSIFSYQISEINYLTDAIGYVEYSPFININKKDSYPSWQMSGTVGYAHASVFLRIKDSIKPNADFAYFLNSIGKTYLPKGLFCYSEPKLLLDITGCNLKESNASRYTLFRFVKQHYRLHWSFLLLLNYIIYERKFPLLPLLSSLFYGRVKSGKYDLAGIPHLRHSGIENDDTVDVLIPTIGRKKYLYDVLLDLKNQTHLPKNIIIVEQNANPHGDSELDYLTDESWPFNIKHTFTHQLGACNARNVALEQLESKWVFFADDDVRIEPSFIADCLLNCKNYDKKALTLCCLQQGEKFIDCNPYQWASFGTCSSFVAVDIARHVRFDPGFEFGYAEDYDYGRKIRKTGTDVMYFAHPKLLHLKAPMGGFRTKFKHDWDEDSIKPKPSPTVMLNKLLHETNEEIKGFKTVLFFKFYRRQPIKNPFSYARLFKKQWNQSVYWATQLKEKNNQNKKTAIK